MTFFINARHVFYGIGFIEQFRRMGWRRPYMILTLTDETYSVLCSVQYEKGLDKDRAAFLIAMLDHLYWVFGCFLGACAGQYLQFDLRGIDFSATAFFSSGGRQPVASVPLQAAVLNGCCLCYRVLPAVRQRTVSDPFADYLSGSVDSSQKAD